MEAPAYFDPTTLPGLPLCQQNCSVPVPCDDEPSLVLLPYYASTASCGFPSPADDYVGAVLDLNDLVVRNPPATFFLRASGDSMVGAGIFDGDLVVVDRSLEAKPGDIVVAEVDGAFTLKRYAIRQGRKLLVPENEGFPIIAFGEREEIAFFGVVTFTVKAHGRRRA